MTESISSNFVQPLESCLHQLEQFVISLSNDQYAKKPASGGSIGAHVRHVVDHATALVDGLQSGTICYDQRQRGTTVEFESETGLTTIRQLCEALSQLRDRAVDEQVMVELILSADAPPQRMPSTLGRELAFVLSHTVHHHAMMRFQAEQLGIGVAEWFGYAPSTIQYQKPRCVPSQS